MLRINYPMSFKNMTPEDTKAYLNLWSVSFKDYEYLAVATAVNEIIQSDTREFAPNIATVKQQINKRYVCSTIEAGEAWQQVLSTCSCNPAKAKKNYESLSRNIQRALGGSYMLVDIGNSTNANQGYLRDKFLIRYENIQNEEVKALSAGRLTQQEFIEHDRKPGALLQEGLHKVDFKGLLK